MAGQFVGQKKPAVVVAIHAGGKGDASGDPGPDDSTGDSGAPSDTSGKASQTLVCPVCGAHINPDDPTDFTPADDSNKDATGKGPDLSQPSSIPDSQDAQAPMGEDAITKALAAVLGGAR